MKFVVGCPLAAVDISKVDNACVMNEVEIKNEGTFGHQLRIGWMHDQQQNYLLNAAKNVGDEYGTIAMDRFSRKCYLSGSIGIDLSPRSEDFLLDSYSTATSFEVRRFFQRLGGGTKMRQSHPHGRRENSKMTALSMLMSSCIEETQ